MKEDEKNSLGCPPVAHQIIEFEDKAIKELKIVSTKYNIDVRFKNLLILKNYCPLILSFKNLFIETILWYDY